MTELDNHAKADGAPVLIELDSDQRELFMLSCEAPEGCDLSFFANLRSPDACELFPEESNCGVTAAQPLYKDIASIVIETPAGDVHETQVSIASEDGLAFDAIVRDAEYLSQPEGLYLVSVTRAPTIDRVLELAFAAQWTPAEPEPESGCEDLSGNCLIELASDQRELFMVACEAPEGCDLSFFASLRSPEFCELFPEDFNCAVTATEPLEKEIAAMTIQTPAGDVHETQVSIASEDGLAFDTIVRDAEYLSQPEGLYLVSVTRAPSIDRELEVAFTTQRTPSEPELEPACEDLGGQCLTDPETETFPADCQAHYGLDELEGTCQGFTETCCGA